MCWTEIRCSLMSFFPQPNPYVPPTDAHSIPVSLYIHTTSSDPQQHKRMNQMSSFKGLFYISNHRETIILSCHRASLMISFFKGWDSKTINKRKGSSFLIYKLCLIIHLPLMRQSAGNVFSPRAYKIWTDSTNLHAALDSVWAAEAWFVGTQHIHLVQAAVRIDKNTTTITWFHCFRFQ